MRMRWLTIALTLGLFRRCRSWPLPFVPRQFFPSSDRPELLVDLSLPQNASIDASQTVADQFDDVLKGDPDVAHWSTYVGRGAIRFYLPLNVQLPNDSSRQAVVVAKDVAARERLQARLEKELAEQIPECGRSRVAARARPAGRLAGAVSGERPDPHEVRAIALRLAQVMGGNPQSSASISTGWSRPGRSASRIDQDQARLLGLSSQASPRCSTPWCPGPRSPRCATTSISSTSSSAHRRAAHLALDAAHPAVPASERPHRAAQPVRHFRVRSGIPGDLAPRPGADADRSGRVAAGVSPEASVDALAPGDRRSSMPGLPQAIASPSAARSRKAPNRRPRSSPWFRSCCS